MKILKIKSKWKRLVMFDFDDTLAITEEVTLVKEKKSNRIVDHLHGQAQFDEHELNEKKYYYDFSEFVTVSNYAKPINATLDLMRDFLLDKDTKVIVLTARQDASKRSISDFLDRQGIESDRVSVFGTNGSAFKAAYLSKLIKRFNISKSVTVFEDSVKNISDMISLEYHYPRVKFDFIQIIDPNSDEDLEDVELDKTLLIDGKKKEETTRSVSSNPKKRREVKEVNRESEFSLFKIISRRYLKSGYPRLLKKKKVED